MQDNDKAFLEFIVGSLVDHKDDIKIDRVVDEMGVLLTLTVNRDDMGKVIGRQGNTAKAMRTLLRVIGMKNNARVNLKINEPAGGEPFSGASASVDDAIAGLKNDMEVI
ncbi:hypothetical protein A3J61_02090 [Candidatus Nomurabacteria bacterium RIFCSPHIGHO2_02_FULL_38_15]|uniref:RNA-binding protein KhpA n=1 Tax=Candidatus Nomurabacteria bacterium RIFCSPHIGHO2_02_FULL_38_15 TaxID=1801752 RepID=A0A1F6VRQ9_9BACT|nr:MAG: hypothetical protein A3J61_02090 [Candidatus Nomurabacteria bacterium RIFCSPHIGHO2_02_FULL_38_15]